MVTRERGGDGKSVMVFGKEGAFYFTYFLTLDLAGRLQTAVVCRMCMTELVPEMQR